MDKVVLEQEMEMEEETITNKLQRQVDLLLASFRHVEGKLQARGISLAELGVTPPVIEIKGVTEGVSVCVCVTLKSIVRPIERATGAKSVCVSAAIRQ